MDINSKLLKFDGEIGPQFLDVEDKTDGPDGTMKPLTKDVLQPKNQNVTDAQAKVELEQIKQQAAENGSLVLQELKNLNENNGIALSAYDKSVEALTKSDSLQTQLDQVVVEGDSSVEAAQARVEKDGTTNATLKARLDKKEAEFTQNLVNVTSQLADTVKQVNNVAGISFEQFGAIGDGVHDDSTAIGAALKYAQDNGVTKVKGKTGKTYVLKEIQNIVKSNLTIDFNNAKIKWLGNKVINSDQGDVGMFNICGSIRGDNDLLYLRRIRTPGIQIVPVESKVLIKVEKHISDDYTGSRIKTSDNTSFNIGDDVLIVGYTTENRRPYNTNRFDIELRLVARVIGVDTEYIYTDYIPAFDNVNFVNVPTERSMIVKVDLVKEVHVKNVVIEDDFKILDKNSPTPIELSKAVSTIVTMLADNCSLQNIKIHENNYCALYNWASRELFQDTISVYNPQMVQPGRGYAIKNTGITKSLQSNVHGEGCRHVVDHAKVHHTVNDNISSVRGTLTPLNFHGSHEHDVLIKNSKCTIWIGSGISNFSEVFGRIVIENHVGEVHMTNQSYIHELEIKDSKIITLGFPKAVKLKVTNTDWDMSLDYELLPFPSRGLSEVKTAYIDARIKINNDLNFRYAYLRDIDNIFFSENTSIEAVYDVSSDTNAGEQCIKIANFDTLILKSKFNNIAIDLESNRRFSSVVINGAQSVFTKAIKNRACFLSLKNLMDCNMIINFLNFTFLCKADLATYSAPIVFVNSAFASGDTSTLIDIRLKDSNLDGGIAGINNGSLSSKPEKVTYNDSGNIIKNAKILTGYSKHGFDETRNILRY